MEQRKAYHYEVDKRRGEPTDKLTDGNDDAIDALSYLIAGLLQGEIIYTNLYPSQEEILRWQQQMMGQQKNEQPDPVTEFLKERLRTLRNPPPSFPNLPPFFPPLPPF
jgi:hypothetical protein